MTFFFLKTIRAHETVPVTAVFAGVPTPQEAPKVEVLDDDKFSVDEETINEVDDVRSEMNEKFESMPNHMNNQSDNTQQEIHDDMSSVFNMFFQQMQTHLHQQNQQNQSGGPMPNNAGSNRTETDVSSLIDLGKEIEEARNYLENTFEWRIR